MRLEILGIILNVMKRERLLNLQSRINRRVSGLERKHLQPQMRHLIAGPVPRHDAFWRLVGFRTFSAELS